MSIIMFLKDGSPVRMHNGLLVRTLPHIEVVRSAPAAMFISSSIVDQKDSKTVAIERSRFVGRDAVAAARSAYWKKISEIKSAITLSEKSLQEAFDVTPLDIKPVDTKCSADNFMEAVKYFMLEKKILATELNRLMGLDHLEIDIGSTAIDLAMRSDLASDRLKFPVQPSVLSGNCIFSVFLDGAKLTEWTGLCVDGDMAYVTDGAGCRIIGVDLVSGNTTVVWEDASVHPCGIACTSEYFFVVDGFGRGIARINRSDMTTIKLFGAYGYESFEFKPSNISMTADNRCVAVSDEHNNRIVFFDIDGKFRRALQGGDVGMSLASTNGIATQNEGGTMLVSDWKQHCVRMFDHEGKYTGCLGSSTLDWGSDHGVFNHPSGVCAIGGYAYVSDTRNIRIQVFEISEKAYVKHWSVGGVPLGCARYHDALVVMTMVEGGGMLNVYE